MSRRPFTVIIPLSLFLLSMGSARAATIYVPDDSTTIQGAINGSADSDTIVVRPGTYVENIDFLGKAIVLMSEQGSSATTIDGNQAGSVVKFVSGEGGNSILNGFTITNGTGELYSNRYNGGGIFCLNSSPMIINNKITGNFVFDRGAGIACHNSSPSITDNVITGNTGGEYSKGGGIYCGNNSNATIMNNTIQANTAIYGGGIVCRFNSNPVISENTIDGNEANSAGGIYCEDSSPTISNNEVSGNQGGIDGGGIFSNYIQSLTSPMITNNRITNNRAIKGGGIRIIGGGNSQPTVLNNTITDNSANEGAGIYYSYNYVTISDNVIASNTASGSPGNGGGIFCFHAPATIVNNVISDNSASNSGGGLYMENASPTITNTISWGNSANSGSEILLAGTSSPTITYSDIENGWTGEGNIEADPVFSNPDYQIQSSSPCIDSGDSTILDGCLPPGLGTKRSDMGAYGGADNCGWQGRPVNLTIEPTDTTIVARGDTLYFSTRIENSTNDSVSGDYWISVSSPPQPEILIPDVYLNYSNPMSGTIPPTDSLTLTNRLFLPTQIDTGAYTIIGRIGIYPNVVIDEHWLDIFVWK